MNLGDNFEDQMFRQRAHGRPVFDVRSHFDLHGRVCHALAVKDAVLVNAAVEEIFPSFDLHIEVRGRRQETFVGCRCRNGTGVHQRHRSDLTVLELGTFPVREVSRGMTDT